MKRYTPLLVLTAGLLQSCAVDPNGQSAMPGSTPGRGVAGWGGGQPPQWGHEAIFDSPGGCRVRYQDLHGRYTATLFPDRRCRFVSISRNETMADTMEGRWNWLRTGVNDGILSIGAEVWTLRFTGPDRATAVTDGDVRVFNFLFERLEPGTP